MRRICPPLGVRTERLSESEGRLRLLTGQPLPSHDPCHAMLFTITSETATMHDDWMPSMGQHHRTLYHSTVYENLVHRLLSLYGSPQPLT
jgi:hypothetical protein